VHLVIGVTLVVAGDSFFTILLAVIAFHQLFEGIALGSRIAALKSTSLVQKLLMAGGFALTTPVGMAIGIGVLDQFNGSSPSTLIAMATLNAFSAGILTWSGVVEMWAGDWVVPGGEMVHADLVKVVVGGFSLMAGMILMSFIGKWA
jgi:zinc transporter 1/2/3